jgi:hypothetical protein
MAREFFDPTPDEQNIVLINAATAREGDQVREILRAMQSG